MTATPELSAEQLAARQKAHTAAERQRRKDSLFQTNRRAIISALQDRALSASHDPITDVFFPAYFYVNSSAANGNSNALVTLHSSQTQDWLFYAFMGLTLLLALIRLLFYGYFNQVFWFFLHPNDRRNNLIEQIRGQHILPSLLLNLFFVITGGLFLTLIIRPNMPDLHFGSTWLMASGLLTGIYLVKYLVILLSGWVFGAPAAATIYNQVVFSINKIIGLMLLPATLLISYGSAATLSHVYTTVVIIIAILLIYRYIASILLIKGKLRVSAFHFILYICAVEIIPLLLVYKVLLTNIGWIV